MRVYILLISLWFHIRSASNSGQQDDLRYNSYLNSIWDETTTDSVTIVPMTTGRMPFFEDPSRFVNITAQLGSTITLSCKVNDLADRTTVSWLKRQDGKLHLLSVGMEIYSGDFRLSAVFKRPNDWQLHLADAEETDEGHYECQVSSHPPIVFNIYVHVVVPQMEIADERGLPIKNKFYNSGSTIELKCIITRVPQPTHFIMWRHGARVLNYDTSRGGISVKTDILPDGAKSRLFIANANHQDSGNYTCSLADVASTSVSLHVLNGETPAAMQHGGTSSNPVMTCLPLQLLVLWTTAHIR